MKICYLLNDIPLAGHSMLASIRYRATIPGEQLIKLGHSVAYKSYYDDFDPAHDVYIIGKAFHPKALELAHYAKAAGKKLILDVCDDHFQNPVSASLYRPLCEIADIIVTATQQMKDVVCRHMGFENELRDEVQVIGDPYEGQYREYVDRREDDGPLNLLWFGHHANLTPMFSVFPALKTLHRKLRPVEVMLVTGANFAREAVERQAKDMPFLVYLVNWSLTSLADALARTDLVMLPSQQTDRFQVKSANRMIEALWAGVPVWAHSTPAYNEFSEFVTIDNDTYPGIKCALTRTDHEERIRLGQLRIAKTYSPQAVAKLWESVL